jgi:predicted Rossmann fold flavoprotein
LPISCDIKVWPTRAGLVPFTLHVADKEKLEVLSGVAAECEVSNERIRFRESMLFTHRGLSGPAVLQISSYWQPGEAVTVNLLPDINIFSLLKAAKQNAPQKQLKTILAEYLPKRVIEVLINTISADEKMATLSHLQLEKIASYLQEWQVKPNGTEGYRTAEVTLGGVDCDAISSKTMEATQVRGLYFIGEVLDVTGWLGGFNFQWAWSSGWAAGQVV